MCHQTNGNFRCQYLKDSKSILPTRQNSSGSKEGRNETSLCDVTNTELHSPLTHHAHALERQKTESVARYSCFLTKAPLNKLTGEPYVHAQGFFRHSSNGRSWRDEDNQGFWWAGAEHANYTSLSTDITNAFNQITQATISETMTSLLHSVLEFMLVFREEPRGHIPPPKLNIAGL